MNEYAIGYRVTKYNIFTIINIITVISENNTILPNFFPAEK